jgi:hypothetical protein
MGVWAAHPDCRVLSALLGTIEWASLVTSRLWKQRSPIQPHCNVSSRESHHASVHHQSMRMGAGGEKASTNLADRALPCHIMCMVGALPIQAFTQTSVVWQSEYALRSARLRSSRLAIAVLDLRQLALDHAHTLRFYYIHSRTWPKPPSIELCTRDRDSPLLVSEAQRLPLHAGGLERP